MTFRDDQEALRARADALQRENEALRQRVASLEHSDEHSRAPAADDDDPPKRLKGTVFFTVGGALLAAGGVAAYITGIGGIIIPTVAFGVMLIGMGMMAGLVEIAAPDELLIFSGRRHVQSDGSVVSYRIERERALRVPIIERVDRISTAARSIEVEVQNAYSKGGVPVTVDGLAIVHVHGTEPHVTNAVERFLGNDKAIGVVAAETIEGALRQVIATLSPEQMRLDGEKFEQLVIAAVDQDLDKVGLAIDSFSVDDIVTFGDGDDDDDDDGDDDDE